MPITREQQCNGLSDSRPSVKRDSYEIPARIIQSPPGERILAGIGEQIRDIELRWNKRQEGDKNRSSVANPRSVINPRLKRTNSQTAYTVVQFIQSYCFTRCYVYVISQKPRPNLKNLPSSATLANCYSKTFHSL